MGDPGASGVTVNQGIVQSSAFAACKRLLLIMLLDGARKDATCQTLSLLMTLSDSLAQSSNVAACVACIHDDNLECGIWTMILHRLHK